MAGFDNNVMYADNVRFDGAAFPGQVTADGELLIGSTVAPNIRVATLTAGGGITIANGSGSITIGVSGLVAQTITGDLGGALVTTAGNWNIQGTTLQTGCGIQTDSTGPSPDFLVSMFSPFDLFDFNFRSTVASITRVLTVENTVDAASSAAELQIQVAGGISADCYTHYQVTGVTEYAQGIDNSDSDNFKLVNGADPSAGTLLWQMDSGGIRTMPLQCAFSAFKTVTSVNVIGGGVTFFTVIFDTEAFDQNGDYNNVTGVFTAPVTGRYYFTGMVGLQTLVAATSTQMFLSVNGGASATNLWNGGGIQFATAGNDYIMNGSRMLALTSGDTVDLQVFGAGEAGDVIDVGGSAGNNLTTWDGWLVV